MIYDEIARQKWTDLSLAAPGFDVNIAATRLDETVMRQAEAKFDALSKEKQASSTKPVKAPYYAANSSWGKRKSDQWYSYPNKQRR